MKRTVSLRIEPQYLSKEECLKKADVLISRGALDMDLKEIAREIYCHAKVYYLFKKLPDISFVRWILRHADPIDMADGGDRLPQRLFFRLVWLF